VTDKQTVELRTITVTRATDIDTVIEKGLTAGETVVTDGQLRLIPGSRVSVKSGPGTKVAS
jgi:multidrug efflux system membrane fusion protein